MNLLTIKEIYFNKTEIEEENAKKNYMKRIINKIKMK